MIRTASTESQLQSWTCPVCTFKNHPHINTCEMCGSARAGAASQAMTEEAEKDGFKCHKCAKTMKDLKAKCEACGEVLIPESDSQEEKIEEGKKFQSKPSTLIPCPHCSLENDSVNVMCVFCGQLMAEYKSEPQIPIKKRARKQYRKIKRYMPGGSNTCQYCHRALYGSSAQEHEQICSFIPKGNLEQKYLLVSKTQCHFCYEKLKPEEADAHERSCRTRVQFFDTSGSTYQRCTKLQIQTMVYMHNKSQKLHWVAKAPLLKRLQKLGYSAQDLQNLHHYIVNYAPIIIHMHANKHMEFFVADTHYRNQFQTKKSSGSLSQTSRTGWQDRMFDRKHHKATPFQRVKYGTINFTNDPKGVRACMGYGQSYFLLKPHVRNRCTVTDMDSSSSMATIATFQFCYHLLLKLPDAELKAAFEGSKAKEVESNVIGTYKEIQIHGPVEFKQDIERVYLSRADLTVPGVEEKVKQFCKNNNLQYQLFGTKVQPVSPFGHGTFGFGMPAPAPTSIFSFGAPPAYSGPIASTAYTAHLFGGGRGRGRSRAPVVMPAAIQEQAEKPSKVEGVDYI